MFAGDATNSLIIELRDASAVDLIEEEDDDNLVAVVVAVAAVVAATITTAVIGLLRGNVDFDAIVRVRVSEPTCTVKNEDVVDVATITGSTEATVDFIAAIGREDDIALIGANAEIVAAIVDIVAAIGRDDDIALIGANAEIVAAIVDVVAAIGREDDIALGARSNNVESAVVDDTAISATTVVRAASKAGVNESTLLVCT
jgi:hypothetical protein